MSDEVVGRHKVVYMRYSVLDETGRVMGQQDMPVGYVHGAGSGLFEEIEAGLEGHRVGETVEIALGPEAFGAHDPGLVITQRIDDVPPMFRFVGAEAGLQNERGEVLTFRVVDIADGKVTLDGNHPLAGRPSRCVVTLLSVRPATAEEVRSGFPAEQGPPPLY